VWEIDRLSEDQLREVFGAERRWLRAPGFPDSERDGDGVPRWWADQVWQWLAAGTPDSAAVVPLRYWRRGEAVYQGAREVTDGVVQDWLVCGVPLRVVWPTVPAAASARAVQAAPTLFPGVARVIKVRYDSGIHGPGLSLHDEAGRRVESGEPLWPELALVLGGRAPYWPLRLRDAAAMRRWRPGNPPVPVAAAIEAPDPAPLLRLAAAIPATDTAHAVLMELAQSAHCRAGEDAARDVEDITTDPDVASWVELGATSLRFPEPPDLDEVVHRDGWLAVAARPDTLAHQAVVEVLKSGYTSGLPYTTAEYVDPTSALGSEWAARLLPASPYAGFEVLYARLTPDEEASVTDYLTDPATDAPVIRLASGLLLAAVPHRLPTTSPLAAATVDEPIWVRLADGTVHLAPRRDAPGISWGYAGSGTSTLALLLAQLLDDITAPAPDRFHGGGPGLEKLLTTDWPNGTTFTRADLETARSGLA
jgi:hypothetical protein